MKWLFLLLLVINIGLFAWGQQGEAERTASAPLNLPGTADHGNLQLLSELETAGDPTAPGDTSESTAGPFTEPLAEVVIHQEQPVAAVAETPRQAPVEVPLDAIPQVDDFTPVEPRTSETPTAAPDNPVYEEARHPSATRPPEAQVERALYLQPPRRPTRESADGIATNSTTPTTAPQGPYPCGILEEIRREIDGFLLVDRLRQRGIPAQLTKSPDRGDTYWVLIPPQPSRQQAETIMATLIARGFEKPWLVDRGNLENAVSLGIFSNLGNAQSYVTRVARLGLPVELKRKKASPGGYAVHFPIGEGIAPNTATWTQLENRHPNLQLRTARCEAIASSESMP